MNEPPTKEKCYEDVVLRLAAGLLLQRKELSYSEILALPMVERDSDVERIMEYLSSRYNARKVQIRRSSAPVLSWETVLKLDCARCDSEPAGTV